MKLGLGEVPTDVLNVLSYVSLLHLDEQVFVLFFTIAMILIKKLKETVKERSRRYHNFFNK